MAAGAPVVQGLLDGCCRCALSDCTLRTLVGPLAFRFGAEKLPPVVLLAAFRALANVSCSNVAELAVPRWDLHVVFSRRSGTTFFGPRRCCILS